MNTTGSHINTPPLAVIIIISHEISIVKFYFTLNSLLQPCDALREQWSTFLWNGLYLPESILEHK